MGRLCEWGECAAGDGAADGPELTVVLAKVTHSKFPFQVGWALAEWFLLMPLKTSTGGRGMRNLRLLHRTRWFGTCSTAYHRQTWATGRSMVVETSIRITPPPRAEPSRSKVGDIKDLLAIRDNDVCPCEPAEELLRSRTN